MAFKSKYTGQEIENILDQAKNGGNLDSTKYATKAEVANKVNGDGNILNIVKVSTMPDNPDEKTLYIVVE